MQEEVLWMQKSRVDYLKMSDKNMKFFHTTLIRRRGNKIQILKNGNGEWISDSDGLKNMVVRYCRELFTSDRTTRGDFIIGCFPTLDAHAIEDLAKDVSMEEITKAL